MKAFGKEKYEPKNYILFSQNINHDVKKKLYGIINGDNEDRTTIKMREVLLLLWAIEEGATKFEIDNHPILKLI